MTTQEKKSFEERLEEKIGKEFSLKSAFMARFPQEHDKRVFEYAAHWAREETLSEVFNILGAARLFEIADMLHYQLRSKEFESVHPELTDESEIKLKDPSFVLPEYY